FFQAEDGIRAFHVTGVQTCALPISAARLELDAGDALVLRPRRADVDRIAGRRRHAEDVGALAGRGVADRAAAEAVAPGGREIDRSEERRVGKECRWRGGAEAARAAR